MKKHTYIAILLMSLWSLSASLQAEILLNPDDPNYQLKREALEEIDEVMGRVSNARYVDESEAILYWDLDSAGVAQFIPVSPTNEQELRERIESGCQCSTKERPLIGVMIASPLEAVTMYERVGWNSSDGSRVEGIVPPLVVIYHELAHAADFLRSPSHFDFMASTPDPRWMNLAEESACRQQNDLVLGLIYHRGLRFGLRQSYGRYVTHRVEHFLEI